MTRRWLLVLEDPKGELESEAEAAAYLTALIDSEQSGFRVLRVQRGGLLAAKVMDELPPVRHRDQGVYR